MKNYFIFGAALAIALVGPASANGFYRYMSPPSLSTKAIGGIIGPAGDIIVGSGFTVAHSGTGVYDISFAANTFNLCGAMTVTSSMRHVTAIALPRVCRPHSTYTIELFQAKDQTPEDSRFNFTIVGT
jgi:hypothetical protein